LKYFELIGANEVSCDCGNLKKKQSLKLTFHTCNNFYSQHIIFKKEQKERTKWLGLNYLTA
jgi:hypothetical protein